MKICVVTRSYPAPGDLYKYPFVHRRLLAYAQAGHEVSVVRPVPDGEVSSHAYEGITCWSGGRDFLRDFADRWQPDVIAAHGFSEAMWHVLEPVARSVSICAWLHGSEIPEFMRRKALVAPEAERGAALEQLRERCEFWEGFLVDFPERFRLVFVSESSIDLARQDWSSALREDHFAVIPNPIDTGLFEYRAKAADDRFNVLLIRPFDSRTYANDLAVDAIADLLKRPGSERLSFTIIGDGPLFEQTLAPLLNVPNVTISRRFLSQKEIVEEHRRHGLFLVPTRLDTQGVSRDEAMASGLVPITNSVPAVREFVDDSCAALAPEDDGGGLADALWEMIENPALFLDRSRSAAERIRADRSNALIVPRELSLLEQSVNG